MKRSFIVGIMGFFVVLVLMTVVVAMYPGDVPDDFHCWLGVISLGFVVASLVIGMVQAGRFGKVTSRVFLRIHFATTVAMAMFFTTVFVVGVARAGWTWDNGPHSIVGVLIVAVVWLATGLSPCLSGRRVGWKRASVLHAVLGIVLLALVIAQAFIGYFVIHG